MDIVLRPYANKNNVVIEDESVLDIPPDVTDTFHFSHCGGVIIKNCAIQSGLEDAVDFNNKCSSVLVRDSELHLSGTMGVTIKGGTEDVVLENVLIRGRGKETDIDLGNRSEQSKDLTKAVVLHNVTHEDGNPVRVRVLWANKPVVIGGNVKVMVYPRWAIWVWRLFW